jgi:membrane-associated phospholipid phosphatase
LADAGIASWDAKYAYDLWRPIDAIREANTDGNSSTNLDPTWMPLINTPPFPTYTSGHSTFSGAATAVLAALFGDNVSFTSQLDGQNASSQRPLDPSLIVTRSFASFKAAATEAGLSRIYGGIHFAFDNEAGHAAGVLVGQLVVTELMQRI